MVVGIRHIPSVFRVINNKFIKPITFLCVEIDRMSDQCAQGESSCRHKKDTL